MLAEDDPLGPAFYLVAAAVSASRVHLRQHHASDVLGGAVVGIALGRLGRSLSRRWRHEAGGMGPAGSVLGSS
jgi:membrane-associated phospholipid phosphatase